MKSLFTVLLASAATLTLAAQTPKPQTAKPQTAKPQAAKAPGAKAKPAAAAPTDTPEGQTTRQAFNAVLNAVNDGWFGKPYDGMRSVDINGTLKIALSGAAINQKAAEVSQGLVKGNSGGGNVNMKVKSAYFANGDFKTELNGDFGNLLYYRSGMQGFLYSREMNAYTTRVDPPPSDAPLFFVSWFRQSLNDIKAVYVDGTTFKANLGTDEPTHQTLRFNAPTTAYDPQKREQSLAESMGFWKRGKLDVTYSKGTHLPSRMIYTNDAQGISTRLDFTYEGARVQSITLSNQSKGMEGPGNITVTYGGDGLMSAVAGQMTFPKGTLTFDLGLHWVKDRMPKDIRAIPPVGSTKRGREEFETSLMVALAGKILDLQRSGLNLRSVSLSK